MTNVYLIRHAQSEDNLKAIIYSEAPLSEEGMRQAESSRGTLDFKPDIVVTGTLKRQIQTAEIMFPHIYDYQMDENFDEIRFGDLETAEMTQEIIREISNDITRLRHIYHGDDVWKRVTKSISCIKDISKKHPNENVVIVTSATLIQAIICRLLYGKQESHFIWTPRLHINNCEYIQLVVNDRAVTQKGRHYTVIDRLYINGENRLFVPAWKTSAKGHDFELL